MTSPPDESPPSGKLHWRWWGLVWLVATFLGFFEAHQTITWLRLEGITIPWSTAVIWGLADWYLWAALAPVIVALSRRLPMEQGKWKVALLVHIPVCLLYSCEIVMMMVMLFSFWFPNEEGLLNVYLGHVMFYVWIYWAIAGASYALDYYRKYRERALHASQLKARLSLAQLQALTMQLHPHFLFNTLNAISSLMHRDIDLADRMIARLGELLRLTLHSDATQEVTLRQEMTFLQSYLEIEAARLGPRLRLSWDVDPKLESVLVPNLILQPLVENAVRHGIAPRIEGGEIAIRAFAEGDDLVLEVQDDGPGMNSSLSPAGSTGIGLSNTRARLAELYGPSHRFELIHPPAGGLKVRLHIPMQRAEETHEPPVMEVADPRTLLPAVPMLLL